MDLADKLQALGEWFSEKAVLIRLSYASTHVQPLMPRMGDVYLAQ